MKKYKWIFLVFAFSMITIGCAKEKEEKKKNPIEAELESVADVSEHFQTDFSECKSKTYINLDFSECKSRFSSVSSCADLKLKFTTEKRTRKEQYDLFQKYCTFFFGEYDKSNILFTCEDDGQLMKFNKTDQKTISEDNSINGKYTWHPKYDTYQEEIEKGDLEIDSLIYRDVKKKEYLWWMLDREAFPRWMNRGGVYPAFETEDSRVSSWVPREDIRKKETSFYNDGSHDKESYLLQGQWVSVKEAVDFFEKEYIHNLPGEVDENYTLSVSDIDVVKVDKENYAYIFSYSAAWKNIPYPCNGEEVSDMDHSEWYSYLGEAIMSKKEEVDTMIGFDLPKTEEKQVDKLLSFKKAVDMLSDYMTHDVKFRVRTADLVYSGLYNKKQTTAELFPTWNFILYNPNDDLNYLVSVNAETGYCDYYSYSSYVEEAK